MLLLKSFSLLSLLCFLGGCSKSVLHSNLGYLKMYSKDNIGAEKELMKSLSEDHLNFGARYNLSMNNLMLEKLKNSLTELTALEKTYEKGLKTSNSKELYNVYFAKAFVLSMVQDFDQALETYQKALRINPESIPVKKNIELLTQKQSQSGSGEGSSKDQKGENDKGKEGSEGESLSNENGSEEKSSSSPKGEDKESLKKKNLSKEEIEQILKEIKEQESKVRAKDSRKEGGSGEGDDEKSW